jgi:hypothetical protein
MMYMIAIKNILVHQNKTSQITYIHKQHIVCW